ncbi:hypothetical protein ACHAQA_003267 [Verticillium albo-atrum]
MSTNVVTEDSRPETAFGPPSPPPPPPPPPPPVDSKQTTAPRTPVPPVVLSTGPLGDFLVELLTFSGSPFNDHWAYWISSRNNSDIGLELHATGDVRNGFKLEIKRSYDLTEPGNSPTMRIPLQWVGSEHWNEEVMFNNGVFTFDDTPVCGFEACAFEVEAPGKSLNDEASEDFPVLIEWLFPPFYFPLSDQSKSSQTLEVMWSTNVTGSSFMFDPEKIAAEFPTEHAPKMTPAEATVATQNNGNIIRISQPGRESWPANEQDSQHFFVQTSWVAAQVEHAREWHAEQREQSEKKWKLGVGISVGLGIPVIVAVTFLLAKRGSVATLSGKSLPK